jgi:IPT/TIG domain
VPTGASDGSISLHVGSAVVAAPGTFSVVKMTGLGGPYGNAGNVGSSVTITGTHLDSTSTLTFGGATTAPVSISANGTTVTAAVPALGKTGPVTVVTAYGTVTGGSDFAVVPTVSSRTPEGGVAGTSVTITGTGFAGVTRVSFGSTTSADGVPAVFTTSAGATKIVTTVPDGGSPGRILLAVPSTNTAPAVGAWTDTFHTLLLGEPSPGIALPGDELTVGGWSLEGITNVSFSGGVTATPHANSNEYFLYLTVPAGAQTGKFTVHTKYGDVTTSKNLVIEGITSFSPSGGGAGTVVTINGKGFTQDPANPIQNVVVGGAWVASFTVNSDTKITATLPAYGFSTGEVSIFTPVGAYTLWQPYFQVPTALASFTPASGTSGTYVVIHGTNLRYNVDGVRFNGADAPWGFDSIAQDAYAWVPNGATSGLISVHTTTSGWITSSQPFTVT